jgi:hypothetical protein
MLRPYSSDGLQMRRRFLIALVLLLPILALLVGLGWTAPL